ncbi:AAA family ATPase [Micromonospora sp. NPDC005215]|uniref:helix-turn-helix transcriptional regulator n=1 Tax=Micromonospora sp. NPDC005215 TaxID=3157024 RepID=UPI0033AC8A59
MLVGRDHELSIVRAATAAVAAGESRCLIVEGAAGSGKSAMVAAAARAGRADGLVVAAGEITVADQVAPLGGLLTALRSGIPDLGIDHLMAADPTRLNFVERLRDRLADLARQRPVMIVLDDVHRAGDLTALALRLLVPSLASSPVLWLLTRRSRRGGTGVSELLADLGRTGAETLTLGPLDDDAAITICVALLGGRPDAALRRAVLRCEGDPALLSGHLSAVREVAAVEVRDGVAALTDAVLPRPFLDAVERQLAALPAETRRLIEAASILPRPCTAYELAAIQGRNVTELLPAVTSVLDEEILVEVGAALSFRHELFREAVHERLPGPARVVLHREAATVLKHAPPVTAEELAGHILEGGWSGEELSCRLLDLITADEQEAPHEFVTRIFRRLMVRGQYSEARRIVDRTSTLRLDAYRRGGLLLELAEAVTHAGLDIDLNNSIMVARNAGQVTEPTLARLLAAQAHALLQAHNFVAAESAATEAIEVADRHGERAAHAVASVARAVMASADGELDNAVRHAREAVAALDGIDPQQHPHRPQLWLARTLIAVDRMAEAEEVLDAGQRADRLRSGAWSGPLWQYNRALLRMALGQLTQARAEAEEVVAAARPLTMAHVRPLALLGHLAMLCNDMPAARLHLRRAAELAPDQGCGALELSWRTALMYDSDDQPRAAVAALEMMYRVLPERPLFLAEEPQAAAALVRIARRADEPDKAAAAAAVARGLVSRNRPHRAIVAGARHAEALVRGDTRMLRSAVEEYSATSRPLARAAAVEDTATAEGARGNSAAAVPLLREAYDEYTAAGAKRDAARVKLMLDRYRSTSGPAAPVAPAVPGWADLTESELRVVTLVAEGLTNREVAARLFLSPHTVDSHLRSSFAKLGVCSRVQLTRLAMLHSARHPEKT